jgi:hypothetical protein
MGTSLNCLFEEWQVTRMVLKKDDTRHVWICGIFFQHHNEQHCVYASAQDVDAAISSASVSLEDVRRWRAVKYEPTPKA